MSITGKTHTILIVDDEVRLRKALERSFRQEGYQTLAAVSGEEALALLQKEKADLVIADLVMPGMDGISLVRSIRESDPGMKVIILTAYGSAESMAEAEALGVADYLTKPFDLFHLQSRVRMLLKAPEAWASGGQKSPLSLVCSSIGKTFGVVVSLPGRVVHLERLVFAAGKAAGAVSGRCLGIRRRYAETR